MALKKKKQHKGKIGRYAQISAVLIKHGLGELLMPGSANKAEESQSFYRRIRLAIEELGATFVKFGQIMSNRPDLLPPGLIRELEQLQSDVPPFSNPLEVLSEEMPDWEEHFTSIEGNPIASGSIAQVHRGLLKNGASVIIKIQRPGLEKQVAVDIKILHGLTGLLNRFFLPGVDLNIDNVLSEFSRSLDREMDFVIEGTHIQKFIRMFEDNDTIHTPACYTDLTSKKILVMEYVKGIKVNHFEELKSRGYDLALIAARGADLMLEQIFLHGFFHADPHPGNIHILKDNTICFLDFGMMGYIQPLHRDYLAVILVSILNRDIRTILRVLKKLHLSHDIHNQEELEIEIFELIEQYSDIPLHAIDIAVLGQKMIGLMIKYKFRMPSGVVMLLKSLITLEGLGRQLNPEFDLVSHISPFVRKLIASQFDPKRLAKSLPLVSAELLFMSKELPGELYEILNKIKEGEISIDVKKDSLDNIFTNSSKIIGRLSLSLVLSSFAIGSSIIISANPPPLYNGVSLFGIAGFAITGITALWMLLRK